MKKNNYMLLAEIVRMRRIVSGLSLRAMAKKLGISHTELSRIENGERMNYNLTTLIRLCEILEMDFVKLLKITGYLPCKVDELDPETLEYIRAFNELNDKYPKGKDEDELIVITIVGDFK